MQRELEKLRKANAKIMEAVEAAVARGVKEYSMPDLAIRAMLADIIKDHLFLPIAEEKDAPPSRQGVANPSPAAPPKKVFDKSAWKVPTPSGAVEVPVSMGRPGSPGEGGGLLASQDNPGQANSGSPVLDNPAIAAGGFNRGAFNAAPLNQPGN